MNLSMTCAETLPVRLRHMSAQLHAAVHVTSERSKVNTSTSIFYPAKHAVNVFRRLGECNQQVNSILAWSEKAWPPPSDH